MTRLRAKFIYYWCRVASYERLITIEMNNARLAGSSFKRVATKLLICFRGRFSGLSCANEY